MKKVLLVAVVVAAVMVLVFYMGSRRDLSMYEHLKQPQMRTMPAQKMLVTEVKGNPNVTGGQAFSALFKAFYKLKGKVKGLKMSAPRARWPKSPDTPKDEWVGVYGLPIPESVATLPAQKSGPEVKIEHWEYGEVAEILHIGSFGEECPTIEKLYNFIKDNGYKIAGCHEEEYLRGPGMFFKGNPDKYQTIIRYPVKKK